MLGLSLDDFHRLTPAELYGAYDAYLADKKREWEQTKYIMWAALRPHYKKLDPDDVLNTNPKKAPPKREELTPKQREAQAKLFAKMDALALAESKQANA